MRVNFIIVCEYTKLLSQYRADGALNGQPKCWQDVYQQVFAADCCQPCTFQLSRGSAKARAFMRVCGFSHACVRTCVNWTDVASDIAICSEVHRAWAVHFDRLHLECCAQQGRLVVIPLGVVRKEGRLDASHQPRCECIFCSNCFEC